MESLVLRPLQGELFLAKTLLVEIELTSIRTWRTSIRKYKVPFERQLSTLETELVDTLSDLLATTSISAIVF